MSLTTIAGVPVSWNEEFLEYTAGFQVDGDGSPRCYHPISARGLDALASSGYPDDYDTYKDVLACDPKQPRQPIVQDGRSLSQPCNGYFISMTSYEWKQYPKDDVRRYVNAEEVPYVVIPRQVPALIGPRVLGCKVQVRIGGGEWHDAVCVDKGPKSKIGEGSVKLASLLGLNPSPRSGGTSRKIVTFRYFPGVPAVVNGVQYELRAA